MEIVIQMQHSRSTKGTEVYATDDPNALVQTIYLRKSAIENTTPKAITLTISSIDS